MLSSNECREQAKGYVKLAAQSTDPVLKQRLAETAHGWARLAADLANMDELEKLRGTNKRIA